MDNNLICVAKCNKPQGVKGELKVTVLMDREKDICKISALKQQNEADFHNIERVFAVSGGYGIKLNGVNTYEEALKYKGKNLYAKKNEVDSLINSDDFYMADLIGKKAVFENGEELGIIDDIENYGASDIVFILSKQYKNLSFANIGGIITKINYANNEVILNEKEFKKVCVYDE